MKIKRTVRALSATILLLPLLVFAATPSVWAAEAATKSERAGTGEFDQKEKFTHFRVGNKNVKSIFKKFDTGK